MIESITNVNFQVEVKFDSMPTKTYQMQGVIVEQDANNYLRFEIGSNGSQTYLAASMIVNSTETREFFTPIAITGPSVWMRVQKSGSTWTEYWSPDGTTYNTGATFAESLTPARIGPYGGNWASPASSAQAYTASVDYFFNTASPISPEDGGGPGISLVSVTPGANGATLTWSSDVAASSRIDYGLTTSYGSNVNSATLVTNHTIVLSGLTCATLYDFQATSTVSTGSTVSPNGTFTTSACLIPDLTVTKTHSGSFTQGGSGIYTITVSNVGGGPTSGTVTVTDTVPAGLTATSLTGTGWTCAISPTVNCTRSDALGASTSYPVITLTVSVAANAPASVTNTVTVSGGGETNTSNDTASDPTTIVTTAGAGPTSDDFHTTALNASLWTLVNPLGDGSYTLTGSDLVLFVPGGTNHDPTFGDTDNALRLVQTIDNVNFQVEVKFDSVPAKGYQMQGIIVEQDVNNYLRFEIGFNGSQTYLSASMIVNSTETAEFFSPIAITGSSVWMRVQRSGSNWTEYWSPNGTTFNTGANLTEALTPARIGPYAGNWASSPSAAQAYSALVDYFFNTASPIVPEDAGGPDLSLVSVTPGANGATLTWTTDVVASSRVDYGASMSYGSNVSKSTLVTSHSIALSGLTCSTDYDFQVTSTVSSGTTVSPNGTFATSACASPPISDDFRNIALDTSLWTFVDPAGGSYSLNGTDLFLTTPGGFVHDPVLNGSNQSVRMMQSIPNGNFQVK